MRIVTLKRWGNFTKRQKVGLMGGVLLACLVIGTLWGVTRGEEPSSLPSQESLPVNAHPEAQVIDFSTERPKVLPQGEDYFVNYRLQREASRQEAKDMLAPLLNSNVEKTKTETQEKWLQLTHKIEKEEQIENLLKITGIQDAVADLGNNEVAVIVFAPHLNSEEIKLIQDVVLRVTDMPREYIRISYRY
ncbi:MAG: SpoIIIAH-like family protein [Desulfitobacterium sp.]